MSAGDGTGEETSFGRCESSLAVKLLEQAPIPSAVTKRAAELSNQGDIITSLPEADPYPLAPTKKSAHTEESVLETLVFVVTS